MKSDWNANFCGTRIRIKVQKVIVRIFDFDSRYEQAVDFHLSRMVSSGQGSEVVVAMVKSLAAREQGGMEEQDGYRDVRFCETDSKMEDHGWGGLLELMQHYPTGWQSVANGVQNWWQSRTKKVANRCQVSSPALP